MLVTQNYKIQLNVFFQIRETWYRENRPAPVVFVLDQVKTIQYLKLREADGALISLLLLLLGVPGLRWGSFCELVGEGVPLYAGPGNGLVELMYFSSSSLTSSSSFIIPFFIIIIIIIIGENFLFLQPAGSASHPCASPPRLCMKPHVLLDREVVEEHTERIEIHFY